MGSLTAGGAGAIGTSAFGGVQADRTISVEVAGDASAYLGLEGRDSEYVVDDGSNGELEIRLDSTNTTTAGGEGVNPNAVTIVENIFEITNQGTQTVDLWAEKSGDHPGAVLLGLQNNSAGAGNDIFNTLVDNPPTICSDLFYGAANKCQPQGTGASLDPGDSYFVQLIVDTRPAGVDVNDAILTDITIYADGMS